MRTAPPGSGRGTRGVHPTLEARPRWGWSRVGVGGGRFTELGPTPASFPGAGRGARRGGAARGRTHRSAGSAGSLAPAGRSAEGRQERKSVRACR